MATIYERLQEYYKRADAEIFSQKKITLMSAFLARIYDRRRNPLPGYKESREGACVFKVRDYPDFFVPVIDKYIALNHEQIKNGTPFEWEQSGASFSTHRRYRYALWRRWDNRKPLVAFIGLNPSTADETDDDPTIRRVKRFAADWGYGGVYMLNLFAFISTDPKQLIVDQKFKIGRKNDEYLKHIGKKCKLIVFAWGNFKVNGRDKDVIKMFPNAVCLGKNKNGSPKHPLYIHSSTQCVKFNCE